MDSLPAISPTGSAAHPIPTAWIESGAVVPVRSAAAATPTTFDATPVLAGTSTEPMRGFAMLDALANAMLGIPPVPVALESAQLAMQAVPSVPPAVADAVTETVTGAAPVAHDPTLVASVGGALAGFASATGRAISHVTGSGTAKARKVSAEIWAGIRNPALVHVTQVPSKYNAAPAANNRDCGPASVVMTLKLLGKSIPGVGTSATPQKLINRVRQLAGNVSNTVSTSNLQLEKALIAAGATVSELADARSIRASIEAGNPIILNGNPRARGAYGSHYSASQMTPYDGAHWIVVSGMDTRTGKYIVNDPLSKIGPIKVSPSQLEAYRGGSMGIAVGG